LLARLRIDIAQAADERLGCRRRGCCEVENPGKTHQQGSERAVPAGAAAGFEPSCAHEPMVLPKRLKSQGETEVSVVSGACCMSAHFLVRDVVIEAGFRDNNQSTCTPAARLAEPTAACATNLE